MNECIFLIPKLSLDKILGDLFYSIIILYFDRLSESITLKERIFLIICLYSTIKWTKKSTMTTNLTKSRMQSIHPQMKIGGKFSKERR